MNHDARRPSRKQVLEHIKVAGYEADLKTFLRLKLSNRISAERCKAAWDQGVTSKYLEVKARNEREQGIAS
jgi:hypothetical protein